MHSFQMTPLTDNASSTRNSSCERHRQSYIDFVESCWRFHPATRCYYAQLTEYISSHASKSRASSLQAPKVYDIVAPSSDSSYPLPFVPGQLDKTESAPPQIIILEGFLSADCIGQLGSSFAVQPELFIGHLGLVCRQSQRPILYERPTLPSCRENVIHLSIISLVRSDTEMHTPASSAKKRSEVQNCCSQMEGDLFNQRRYGATRMRHIRMHTSGMASVEQMISFSIIRGSNVDAHSWKCEFPLSYSLSSYR